MNKVIFLGSKNLGYQCLAYLLSNSAILNIEIIAIFSKSSPLDTPNYSIEHLSQQYSIPLYQNLVSLASLPDVDFLISVQYHQILKALHLQKAKKLAVNLHAAPVPEYRGCNQFSFAILDQAQEFGTTLHQMDTSIDGGDILFEKRFAIPTNCWVQQLQQLTNEHSLALFKEKIADIFTQNYRAIPQSHFVHRKTGFHYRQEIEEIKKIDLNWDSQKIERHIRATYFPPFEPPYCIVEQQKMYFSANFGKL